jgi:hypothetical protein
VKSVDMCRYYCPGTGAACGLWCWGEAGQRRVWWHKKRVNKQAARKDEEDEDEDENKGEKEQALSGLWPRLHPPI